MTSSPRVVTALALAILIQMLFVRDAQAYIDAGSLSLGFQMLMAALLSALVILRLYWQKLMKRIRRLGPSGKRDHEQT